MRNLPAALYVKDLFYRGQEHFGCRPRKDFRDVMAYDLISRPLEQLGAVIVDRSEVAFPVESKDDVLGILDQ